MEDEPDASLAGAKGEGRGLVVERFVYVLTASEYDEYDVLGVYETEEQAKAIVLQKQEIDRLQHNKIFRGYGIDRVAFHIMGRGQ